MTETATQVWRGAESLRPLLVPADTLRTHPDNPWHGDVARIRASVKRFGQVRAILADPDGTIVAGNHRYLAMVEEGFTHVAVVANEFKSAEEARDYLLADNRLGQLGGYDSDVLLQELDELAKRGTWDGTGYGQKDVDRLHELAARAAAPPEAPPVRPPPGPAPPPGGGLREVVLMFDPDQRDLFAVALRALVKEYGTEGVTETVVRALHEEADLVRAETDG